MKKEYIFYLTIFLFITALSFAGHYVDYDLWQRLLQGDYFLQNGSVLYDDIFSYVKVHKYIDHEWGSGVIFALILKYFGYAGLTVLKSLIIFSTFLFVFLTLKLNGLKHTKLNNILFFFVAINCFENIFLCGIRCQLFTFLLFSIFIYILEKVRKENKNKLLYLLPLLMLFWVNVHGGCVAGYGLIFMYLIGEFLNKKPFKKYLYALFAAIAVFFINPYGISYIGTLLGYVTLQRTDIAEWQSIFEIGKYVLLKSKIFCFLAVLTGVTSLSRQIKNKYKIDYTKYIVLCVTAYFAFSHIKHLPLFFISALIFLYDDFFELFNGFMSRVCNVLKIKSEKFINGFVAVKENIIYAFLIFSSLVLIGYNYNHLYTSLELKRFPVKVVEFMKINELKGNLLNKFDIGSYLAYKLYPQNLIYMDGRYETVYYPDTTEDNYAFFNNEKNAPNVFTKEGFPDYIIVNKTDYIYPHLNEIEPYKEIFQDDDFVLAVRVDLKKDEYKQPPKDDKYYMNTYFDR